MTKDYQLTDVKEPNDWADYHDIRRYSEMGALLSKVFMQDPMLITRSTVRHIFGRFAIRACGQLLRRAPSRTSSSKIHFLDQNSGGETDLAILSEGVTL
jgi:hypothetical protein